MVKEWVPKSHVTLVRNPDYAWPPSTAAHRGPAHLEEITWRFVPEATTRTAVITTGEAHIAEDLSYADVAALVRSPDVRITRGVPAGTPWTIFPNVQRFPTNDVAVRRALHHAINKDAVVRVVFHGQSQAAGSLLQPPTPGFVPVAKELFPYDPARAKKILDDAGWKLGTDGIRAKNGKRPECVVFGTNNGYEMAWLIQGMARDVGIDIQLREQPACRCTRPGAEQHNIGELNWWSPIRPSSTNFHTSRLRAFNPPRPRPRLDKLLDQASAMVDEGNARSSTSDRVDARGDWRWHRARRSGHDCRHAKECRASASTW
jgi:peptide/nickel transport system substrate-binding protein